MVAPKIAEGHQIPLIHKDHAVDQYLLNTLDGEWFEVLHTFPWEDYRPHAAAYYDALYEFNSAECEVPLRVSDETAESKEAAKQRL